MKNFKQIKNNKGFTRTLNFSKRRSLVCGFTLIETMVAIFILSMALIALLGVISSNIFYAKYARNEITANYLLQEVIDSIRNERDSAILTDSTGGWATFVGKYTECDNSWCLLNAKTGEVYQMSDSSDEEMLLNNSLSYDENASDGSFYGINGTKSNFARRVVVITNPTNPDELDVTVTVYWKNGSVTKTRSLSSSLLNWQ